MRQKLNSMIKIMMIKMDCDDDYDEDYDDLYIIGAVCLSVTKKLVLAPAVCLSVCHKSQYFTPS